MITLILAGGAFAQSDDCGAAVPLAGTGAFAFDTTGHSTSNFDGAGGCAGGSGSIMQDGFWQWSAPAAGSYVFDTNGTLWDTKLSVHLGAACAAVCGDYNDDTSGFQSEVSLVGLAVGDTVLIQVGGFGALDFGGGSLNITPHPCNGLSDDLLEDNDDCANAYLAADGTYIGLLVSQADSDFYTFCVADGAAVDVDLLFTNAYGDLDCFLRAANSTECGTGDGLDELADGFSASDNEHLTWTNNTGAALEVVLEVNVWANSPSSCNVYDLIVSGSGDCGFQPPGPLCDPANPNSTGVPAVLSYSWGTGVGSDLHLEVTNGVPGQLAYFLVGNEGTLGIPISNGLFCLAGTPTAQFYRYNVGGTPMNSIGGFDATGTMINAVGTSTTGFGFDVPNTIPTSVPTAIMAGDTWHFQAWYRDTPAGMGQSNFTNGLRVVF
ncbi:MAG: hypothetical protein JKY61_09210 [Planctomycetes bacterium]|nr:hypothetical protein [Planctomycetota bacterium]